MLDAYGHIPRALVLSLLLTPLAAASQAPAGEASPVFERSEKTSILGTTAGAEFRAGTPDNGPAISRATMFLLGAAIQALSASVNPPNTIDGVTYTEVYSFGKRVFSKSFHSGMTGPTSYKAGLTPVEVRVPLVMYPVGPVIVQVDGGVRFKADLLAALTPETAFPIEDSTLGVTLQADATGSGFVEGHAKFLIVRGGVGGQLDLLDAQANVQSRFAFNGAPPVTMASAMVEFLKGRVYAFVDFFNVARWGWKRLLNYDLYQWNGYCYAAGAIQCPAR